jgi:hypothetical protein
MKLRRVSIGYGRGGVLSVDGGLAPTALGLTALFPVNSVNAPIKR